MIRSMLDKMSLSLARRRQNLGALGALGKPCIIYPTVSFTFHRHISIGAYARIGRECHLDGEGGITIGDGVIFAPRVAVLSSSHVFDDADLLPYSAEDKKAPVTIGPGAWIGWGAIIMPGVEIGAGAVVAAGAVLTKSVGPGEIAGGNPAKVIAQRSNAARVQDLADQDRFYLKAVLAGDARRAGRGDIRRFMIQ